MARGILGLPADGKVRPALWDPDTAPERSPWNQTFRVTTRDGVTLSYQLDRWD